MAYQQLLTFAALLASVIAAWAQMEPLVRLEVTPSGLIEGGDRVVLSCYAENFQGGRVVKLHKYQPQAAAEVTLFTNDALEEKYRAVDRFDLKVNRTDPDRVAFEFKFMIDGAMTEDSGTYRCTITGSNVEDSQRIDILDPPSEIELSIGDSEAEISIDQDGQEVELVAGARREIRCRVQGGNPAPEIKVMAGDIDLTEEFEITPLVTEHPTELPGMFRPEADVSVKTKDSKGLKMEYRFNNKEFGCHAYVQNREEPILSRYFIPKFQGAEPRFYDCPREVMAMTNQKDINITCPVSASPEATKSRWTWLNRHNQSITLQLDEENGQYTGKLEEVNGGMALVLYIGQAMPQTFRTYTFIAENELGKAEHEVEFRRDPADPWTPSGASSTFALPSTLLGLLLAIQVYLHL